MADQDKPISLPDRLRRVLIGKPIPTSKAHHERLGPFIGLPVFSSDALSSVAYATEAILGILVFVGAHALGLTIPITLAICGLIVIIAISYQQTIHAYPSGGGSYIVASENLGKWPGLIAGAALLVDYILTVSVSVAAGIAAITSAFPHLHKYLVLMSLIAVAGVAWANLRGVRESGAVFAVPTYGFIIGILTMLAFGFAHAFSSGPVTHLLPLADPKQLGSEANAFLLFVVLRAFAAGCTALTGIEAVSNGVQAFRAPESKNASITLRWMVFLLVVMFLGIGLLAGHLPQLNLLPTADPHYRTVVSQLAAYAFGFQSFGYYFVQFATAAILILAANTAFADFPRLASLIARDGFLPRPLARQGDRLVFHNGILVLAILAGVLIAAFHGELDLLLPLYAVGVFTAFTLSQAGMVVHWWKLKGAGWRYSITVNAVGAVLSLLVFLIIAGTKFMEGAWIVVLMVPAIVFVFNSINKRYQNISSQLVMTNEESEVHHDHLALLLVPRVHRGIATALDYAQNMKGGVRAIHVVVNEKTVPVVRRDWDKFGRDVPLVVLSSPYRSLIAPVMDYVDELREEAPDRMITVIVAEAVATKPVHKMLQENVALSLKNALYSRKNVVIASVRYFLE